MERRRADDGQPDSWAGAASDGAWYTTQQWAAWKARNEEERCGPGPGMTTPPWRQQQNRMWRAPEHVRNSYSRAYTEYNDDELSRAMSKVLRHQGDRCGVAVNAEGHAAAEHGQPAAGCISDATLEALAGFLRLGLKHFSACSTEPDRELAIDAALVDLATTPGETYSLGADAGDALAKLWACVAFEAPKTTKHSTSPVVGKQAKDQKNFIYWAHICQRHRERIAEGAFAASAAEQGVRGHRERIAEGAFAASAAEQGVRGSVPSWRGGVELSETQNIECFKLTVEHIVDHELTPEQRRNPAYRWSVRDYKGPSLKLRSLHDVIVRKHLGDKRVAMHVYQHGLPDLLCEVDAPPSSRHSATAAEHRGQRVHTENTIQAALAEAVDWIATLAITLSPHQTDVHLPVLRMLSARLGDLSHGQREERRALISSFRQVSDQIAKAKRLVTDRDRGKRRFGDMCADDQQLIEDFETGRLQKRRRSTLAPRGSAFRSQQPSASAAAEHAAASSSATIKKE